MQNFISEYLNGQKKALDSISPDAVNNLIEIFKKAWREDRQIFVFGNGGSATNASHFVTDLGKSGSDKLSKRFRCLSLNDNVSWITALGNDYAYDEVYVGQLRNYARPGDLVMAMSVSGNSPNVVKAIEWAKENGLYTIGLTGGQRGKLASLVDFNITIDSEHFGRVEDAHMGVCHLVCYAFIENPEIVNN
ncbi:D-sedoheptulose-7-phosphate isomerase [Adhaeribacter rhizoryzae]|uniref:SIS domain-containing protein n=1 Tax=Adhaeribacter rhizoryzae TaxID=2607907 RepID=A0A5M6DKZ4_9BACT|nr:SIS domain-containing protein [Adhaeribacter rhizoryzae]KAA5548204.1 SIS domain-containing protein [Adhaeribacter rhizoryzae]